jgi:hypothetical protein
MRKSCGISLNWADRALQMQHVVQLLLKTSRSGASFTLRLRTPSTLLSGVKQTLLVTLPPSLLLGHPFSTSVKLKIPLQEFRIKPNLSILNSTSDSGCR